MLRDWDTPSVRPPQTSHASICCLILLCEETRGSRSALITRFKPEPSFHTEVFTLVLILSQSAVTVTEVTVKPSSSLDKP